MQKLTQREKDVVVYMSTYFLEHNVFPKTKQIREKLGGISRQAVWNIFNRLEEKGYIEKGGRNYLVARPEIKNE